MSDSRLPQQISDAILRLCRERGPEKSICPSEVARQLWDDNQWRQRMADVRGAAVQLAEQGLIEATQKGEVIDLERAVGPVRLRIRARKEH